MEFLTIFMELRGVFVPGSLKLNDHHLIFKNRQTGKVILLKPNEIDLANFQNFSNSTGLRLFLKDGNLYRFSGFKDTDKQAISKYFSKIYKINALEKQLSFKGWNWGTAQFNGSVLSFDVDAKPAFDLPLNYVSSCTAAKNEVTMEFHTNDDAPINLVEMRFFIPTTENNSSNVPTVEAFHEQVIKKANIINVSGDAVAIFREIQCLTPRGRYEITIYQRFIQFHGKTFDYKVSMSSILRMFLLPHPDNTREFFVLSLDSPIKQGQTRYHLLVLIFNKDEEINIELPYNDEEIKEKFEDLGKEIAGPIYEVIAKLLKGITKRKITGPGNFKSNSGISAISCAYKAAAGFLYPLERGFLFVHKPPIYIRFEEIVSVYFARGGTTTTKSFDFEIYLKSGITNKFNNIEKGEYTTLINFISSKKLNIKNTGSTDKISYVEDFGDSDYEDVPDVYLEHVKAEGQDKMDCDESTDEDFDPNLAEVEDVAEEYDSNASMSS